MTSNKICPYCSGQNEPKAVVCEYCKRLIVEPELEKLARFWGKLSEGARKMQWEKMSFED